MYPEKIARAKKSYICHVEEVFGNPLKLASGFFVRDYTKELHCQEFVEINIITSGHGMHYIENRRIPANTGDVFIIPPNIEHGYVGGEGFDVYHVIFRDKFFEKNLPDLQILPSYFILFKAEPLTRFNNTSPLYLTLSKKELNDLTPLLYELEKAGESNNPSSFIMRNHITVAIIATLCKLYSEKKQERSDSTHDTCFMNALAFIHEKFNEKITIDALAKLAMLSRSSFIRKFKEVCHTSPAKYLNQVRIDEAKRLLNNTAFSFSEIANKIGFYDTPHFIKTFTAIEGISPHEYRDGTPIAKMDEK